MEEKGIIPENQAGFRKGLKILDNIYVINYLVIRQLEKREENLVAFFVNLKAAFDSIDRRILVKTMRERGIRTELVEKVEEVLRETRSRVGVGDEVGGDF